MDSVFENPNGAKIQTYGPYYYGYEMSVGPDGKPHVQEWGNTRPLTAVTDSGVREPYVDETLDEKERIYKLVTEMPGIEKSDIKVNVDDNSVSISAEHRDRKYSTKIPLHYKVNKDSAKAKYTNGVLELTLSLAEEKPSGKQVLVE